MTQKLFWSDMYLKEFDALVTKVNGNEIVLDKTAFYPTGGGQPNDTGAIYSDNTRIDIKDVRKDGDDIIHVSEDRVPIKVGDVVHGSVDWERRYAHMRYHSAIHVIDGIVSVRHGSSGLLTGSQIYQDRARVDINMDNFTKEFIDQIIDECNSFNSEGHRIYQREMTRDEALKLPQLARTEPGRELINSLEVVRTIVIEDLDEQSDGGTHVKNTKEIGKLVLDKIENKGKRNKRINFHLE